MSCLDEGNIAKYAGKDLGTILELGPEEKEEAEEEDDEEDKGDETNSQKVEPATVRRQRLTAQQTSSLAGFLKARENVPSSAELREWARRQGRLFGGGGTVQQIRRKLYYMFEAKKKRISLGVPHYECVTNMSVSLICYWKCGLM